MLAAYHRYRKSSAEDYLQNYLCNPTVGVMQTHALRPVEPAGGNWHHAARQGLATPGPESGRPAIRPADEFPVGLDDMIDDRVAEVLDEMLGQRDAPWPGSWLRLALAGLALFLAAGTTVMLRHNVIAVCAIWPCTAAIYLAAVRFTEASRP